MLKRVSLLAAVAVLAGLAVGLNSGTAQDEYLPLSVSIAVPLRAGTRRSIELYGQGNHFHVVLRNVSSKPVSVWRDWCSWGYGSLSFEVTDENGKTWIVKKNARAWTKNYPDFCTIEPNGEYVLDVSFDAGTWDAPPLPDQGKSRTISMQAVFRLGETEESKKSNIWTGKVISEKKEYTLWR